MRRKKDDKSRRTPERTQSFVEKSQTPESEKTKVVMRAQSVRDKAGNGGVVMRRRPVAMNPEDELQKILNRRSNHLEEWEAQMASQKVTEADRAIEEYELLIEAHKQKKQKIVPPELVGSELFSALRTKKIRDSLEDQEKDTTSSEEYVDAVQSPPKDDLNAIIGKVVPVMTWQGSEESATVPESAVLHQVRQEEPKVSSILKKRSSVEEAPIRSILKHDAVEFEPSEIKPVSILKRDSMELDSVDIKPVSILKRDSAEFESHEIKPILRRGSKETDQVNLRPILRRGSQESSLEKPASILKDSQGQRSEESSQVQPILRKAKTVDVTSMDPVFAKLVQQRQDQDSESAEETRWVVIDVTFIRKTYEIVVFDNEPLAAGVTQLHDSLSCSWVTPAASGSLSNTTIPYPLTFSCILNLAVYNMCCFNGFVLWFCPLQIFIQSNLFKRKYIEFICSSLLFISDFFGLSGR